MYIIESVLYFWLYRYKISLGFETTAVYIHVQVILFCSTSMKYVNSCVVVK